MSSTVTAGGMVYWDVTDSCIPVLKYSGYYLYATICGLYGA